VRLVRVSVQRELRLRHLPSAERVPSAWLCGPAARDPLLAGWSVTDHVLSELVTDALAQAVAVRGGQVGGTIMRSDRGTSQYAARAMGQACVR
jgi:hypothetical protein